MRIDEINDITLDLYEKYGFIEDNMSQFKEIIFSNVSKKLDKEEAEKEATKNITNYIVDQIKNGNLYELLKKTAIKKNAMQAFELYDIILKEANITVSIEDIEKITFDKDLEGFYKNCVSTKEKYEGSFLGDVLDSYAAFDGDLNISDEELKSHLSDDQVNDYFAMIANIPVYTREEEQEVIKKYKETNNPMYKDEFISHNLKLAAKIACGYYNDSLKMGLMDLIQEANIGLLIAFDKYNAESGNKFSTYATFWIQQKVNRAIMDQNDTIRIPVHLTETLRQKNKYIKVFFDEFKREPTDEEILEHFGWDEKELKLMKDADAIKTPTSIDQTIENADNRTGRESKLSHFIADEDATNVEEAAINGILKEQLLGYMDECLSSREKYVICARYAINNENEIYTLQAIGDKLGITRERVRQLETIALRKLKTKAMYIKKIETSVINTRESEFDKKKKLSREIFEIKLYSLNKNLRILSYLPDDKYVVVRCRKCGNIFNSSMNDLFDSPYCKRCEKKLKKLKKTK